MYAFYEGADSEASKIDTNRSLNMMQFGLSIISLRVTLGKVIQLRPKTPHTARGVLFDQIQLSSNSALSSTPLFGPLSLALAILANLYHLETS